MNNKSIPEPELFRLVFLVASIVIAMFFATAFVALLFMPNQLIVGMFTDDFRFLLPMALATLCSVIVLVSYARSHLSRYKGHRLHTVNTA